MLTYYNAEPSTTQYLYIDKSLWHEQ